MIGNCDMSICVTLFSAAQEREVKVVLRALYQVSIRSRESYHSQRQPWGKWSKLVRAVVSRYTQIVMFHKYVRD